MGEALISRRASAGGGGSSRKKIADVALSYSSQTVFKYTLQAVPDLIAIISAAVNKVYYIEIIMPEMTAKSTICRARIRIPIIYTTGNIPIEQYQNYIIAADFINASGKSPYISTYGYAAALSTNNAQYRNNQISVEFISGSATTAKWTAEHIAAATAAIYEEDI